MRRQGNRVTDSLALRETETDRQTVSRSSSEKRRAGMYKQILNDKQCSRESK